METGPWWPPFDDLTGEQRWRRVLLLFGVLVASGVAMVLVWPDSPGNIIDFEKAGDDGVHAFLDAWTGSDGTRAAIAILLDFPFLVAYGLGGAILLDGVGRWSASLHEGWSRLLRRGAWLAIAAAGFDVLEDLALLVVIGGREERWPDIAASMAAIKFALIDVFYVVVVVALASAAIARVRR